MPAKLHDVAARAGVSTATVSRFLNSPTVVAAETAERIRAAIADLNYVPNMLAGSLASSRSKVVAVLVPFLAYSIVEETIETMASELAREGFVVMLGLTGNDPARTEEIVRAAIARRVDAIITGVAFPSLKPITENSNVTVIEAWGLPEEPLDVAVGFSHLEVGRELGRFVHGRGYIRPHLITAKGSRAERRRQGFIESWEEAGHAAPTESQVDIPTGFGHSRAAFATMRRVPEMPDVVVCGSDFLAQGLIIEAMNAGLSVPGDFAVIGFGNSAIASEMRPTITSVNIDGKRIAQEAVAIIQKRAAGEEIVERRVDVGFDIIARESA